MYILELLLFLIHQGAQCLSRKTLAKIDLSALVDNFITISELAPDSKTLAVIKADAYGHGSMQVANALNQHTDLFAVAFVDEAKVLRGQGITKPLVSFQGAYDKAECEWAGQNDVWLVVHSEQQLQWIKSLSTERPIIWPKVDTGMHRLGFNPEHFSGYLEKYSELLTEESVIFTHLACADEPNYSKTIEQLERLNNCMGDSGFNYSIANSAGIIHWHKSRQKWNRIGIGMYGGATGPEDNRLSLNPVMTLSAEIIALREIEPKESVGYGATWQAKQTSILATVAIGYADGYPRHAPNGTPAWCNGKRISLVGRVSMDMLIFDVTHLSDVSIGDCVELWGPNISVTEVAECVGTIDYELMTRVSSRVPRVYD